MIFPFNTHHRLGAFPHGRCSMSRRPPSALLSCISLLPFSMSSPHDSPCSTRRVYLLLYLNALRPDQISLICPVIFALVLSSSLRPDAHVVRVCLEDTEYQLSVPFAVYLQTFAAILCTMRALKHDRDCVVFRLLLQALLLRVHLFTLVSLRILRRRRQSSQRSV